MKLTDMFPNLSREHVGNCRAANVEVASDLGLGESGHGKGAYLRDVAFTEFVVVVLHASLNALRVLVCPVIRATDRAAFVNHVAGIVRMGSEKQMIRPNTSAVVALVGDYQPIWDWPVCQFIGNAMSTMRSSPYRVLTIPVGERTSRPYPARIRLSDFAPEPIWRFAPGFVVAFMRAVAALSALVRSYLSAICTSPDKRFYWHNYAHCSTTVLAVEDVVS